MLKDEEIQEIRNRAKLNDNRQIDPMAFAREIERAVLAQAGEQDPKWYLEKSVNEVINVEEYKELIEGDYSVPECYEPLYAHPLPAQAVPEKIKPATRTLEAMGYANGFNDCIDLMLSASPKPQNSDK